MTREEWIAESEQWEKAALEWHALAAAATTWEAWDRCIQHAHACEKSARNKRYYATL